MIILAIYITGILFVGIVCWAAAALTDPSDQREASAMLIACVLVAVFWPIAIPAAVLFAWPMWRESR